MLKGIQHLSIMGLPWKSAQLSSVTAHLQEWGNCWPVPAWQNIPHIQSWRLQSGGYKLPRLENDCFPRVMFACISQTSLLPVIFIHILPCNNGIAIGVSALK